MRVVCSLREIMEELILPKSDLVRELGIDVRTLEKLLIDSDRENWRLDRNALYRYILFAHAHGYEAFEVKPHPIWRTFVTDQETVIFRGSSSIDAPTEAFLADYLERLNSRVSLTSTSTVHHGVEEAMKRSNCLIIGSPQFNSASEIALARFWGAKPFDASPKNQELIPVHILGMEPASNAPSALLIESSRHGFAIKVPGAQQRKFLKVDWLPPEKYRASTEKGKEGAVLVACNRPLGTDKDVTTIVIAGYTGLSTLEAAREAAYKNIPELTPEATPGQPCLAALRLTYKRRVAQSRRSVELRHVEEGSTRWAPPWDDFFSAG